MLRAPPLVCSQPPLHASGSGTPEGVGPLAPGDTVRIAIESVGEMTLPVREQAERSPRAY